MPRSLLVSCFPSRVHDGKLVLPRNAKWGRRRPILSRLAVAVREQLWALPLARLAGEAAVSRDDNHTHPELPHAIFTIAYAERTSVGDGEPLIPYPGRAVNAAVCLEGSGSAAGRHGVAAAVQVAAIPLSGGIGLSCAA